MKNAVAIIPVILLLVGPATAENSPATRGDITNADKEKARKEFSVLVKRIEERRGEMLARWKKSDRAGRARIRQEAREFVVESIVEDVFPSWMGMPWTMAVIRDGLKPDARVPWEAPNKGVSCSFFVVSVLQNAGLRLGGRRTFAGAISLPVQISLTPEKKRRHRWANIGPEGLKKKMLAWGDGLYIVGLNCHIGFLVVKDGDVRFVHSSYTSPQQVVDEPVTDSNAIAYSPSYVVTSVFEDARLINHWLSARPVPFRELKKKK